MSITTPTFYPQPWAANEQLVPLTPAEMAAGYPSGDDQKPSRQSINNVLQYAVNGVLFYLTTGIPAWSSTAVYQMGAIVAHGGRYYASLTNNSINQPPGNAAWTELLWLPSSLDARYAVLNASVAFAACQVANSPVRTFANSPDTGGTMLWPPAGIAVSTGMAWSETAIDPAALATWPPAGIPVSTGSAWGTSIDPSAISGFPSAGVAVSTGSAWDVPIDPTDLPRLGAANTFLKPMTIQGSLTTAGAYVSNQTATGTLYDSIAYAPNIGVGQRFVTLSGLSNNTGMILASGFHSAGSAAANYAFLNLGGTSLETRFDMNGNWTIPGSVHAAGGIAVQGTPAIGASQLNLSAVAGTSYFDAYGPDAATMGTFSIRAAHSDGSGFTNYASFTSTTFQFFQGLYTPWLNAYGAVFLPAPDANGHVIIGQGGEGSPCIYIVRSSAGTVNQRSWSIVSWDNSLRFSARSDDAATDNVWCNVTRTGATVAGIVLAATNINLNGTTTCNGMLSTTGGQNNNGNVNTNGGFFSASVTNTIGKLNMDAGGGTFNGNCVASGFYTSGAKAFRIEHPLDPEQMLTHACIEGPENAVFYRGEIVTVDGNAEVTLPDYFEELTFAEDRSVLLTQVASDGLFTEFSMLMASRVVDGKFTIRTSLPEATVAWEVKAVRRIGWKSWRSRSRRPAKAQEQ